MNEEYFCSYMVFRNSIVSGCGDLIFKSKVTDGNKMLGNIKEHIAKSDFSEFENIDIVITSLNKL